MNSMQRFRQTRSRPGASGRLKLFAKSAVFAVSCSITWCACAAGVDVINLVTDDKKVNPAPLEDGDLKNPWGVSYPSTGPFWVSDNNAGVATIYDGAGNPVCWTVGVGDELQTETGNMVGPTDKGVTDALCTQTDPRLNCLGADGSNPIIKSAFFIPDGKTKGRTTVIVSAIGSFKLTKWDGKQITGVFVPAQDKGPVGTGSTTLQRVVLVK